MKYVSTRGRAPVLEFDDVLLTGLARDGGLYVPEEFPFFTASELREMRGLSYQELAVRVMLPFVEGSITEDELRAMVTDAYGSFRHPAVTPLKQIGTDDWLLELFHGPTLAFKDVALQLLGRLFDHVLKKRGQRVCIVGATSGDTGSAAIEACRDRESIDIIILHPKGRVSEVQRRQMTSVLSPNVRNLAIEGSFDDCQDLVKAMFNDEAFRDEMSLSAVNSINWARIMAQIVYYFWAGLSLGAPERSFTFAVPTGNFGNIYAGYAARRMGLPIDKLVVGSNRNDILTRFLNSGSMVIEGVEPSISPSMDIQVSSNFERLLFDYVDREGATVDAMMKEFRETGRMEMPQGGWRALCQLFEGRRYDDDATRTRIAGLYRDSGELLEPHSIIGVAAGRDCGRPEGSVLVSLATAHPAKFPDAVEQASGLRPGLPTWLGDLFERTERLDSAPNDVEAVKAYVRAAVAKVPA
ncbi:threonine synthase [Telmatospirillum sp. J64-1]|uniref:threonine synthase n=1 Tax=Telmatospirillum sp. J64-1 TaxID=2502183 RepID=UPI00115CC3E1|nr:threonine synthase [Telmatospirillum sp. J64-1]